MKVFDLQCPLMHSFEGWFASEQAFVQQLESGQLECPMCGSRTLSKKLSAPRLNLSGAKPPAVVPEAQTAASVPGTAEHGNPMAALASAWVEISRTLAAASEDVGERFAEEARKMHYGENAQRSIRGKSNFAEMRALAEEGIPVLPLALPEHFDKPLH